jgi:CHAT domain-containing protein
LQQKLKPKEAIIRYVHAEENVFAIYLDSIHLRLYKVGKIETVDSLASLHYNYLKSLNKSYAHTATSLYELLLKPIALSDDLSQLTIITENSLQNVPFETLIKPSGEPLGLHVPIRYSHSFHFENTPLPTHKNSEIIAFAPTYEGESSFEKLENTTKEIAQISKVFPGTY